MQSGKKILVGATKEALVALIMTDTGSGASRLTRPSPRGGAAPLTSALRARAFWRDGGGADIELLEDFLISYRLIMPSRDLLNMLFKVYDTFETKSLVLPKYADSGESAPPRAVRGQRVANALGARPGLAQAHVVPAKVGRVVLEQRLSNGEPGAALQGFDLVCRFGPTSDAKDAQSTDRANDPFRRALAPATPVGRSRRRCSSWGRTRPPRIWRS